MVGTHLNKMEWVRHMRVDDAPQTIFSITEARSASIFSIGTATAEQLSRHGSVQEKEKIKDIFASLPKLV